ncbi:MAG: ABC transporter permease subunit [Pseudomonadota bacterium]|nr:ABC transporter permease subunit [Pseudomonadota bacterium]
MARPKDEVRLKMDYTKSFFPFNTKNSKSLDALKDIEERSLWTSAMQRLIQNKAAYISALLILFLAFVCFVGPYFLSWSYDEIDWDLIEATPPSINNGHFLGTDSLGRDLLARILQGGQVSFQVGLLATMVAVLIGVTVGSLAGFLGGWVDQVLMRIVDILYVIPLMFFIIILMVIFGRNFYLMFIAIGFVEWLTMSRIVRGQTMTLRHKEFIDSARVSGSSNTRIIFKHIIPNILGVVVVYVTLTIPQVILLESFLSFLGLGVQPPMTSWGALISEGAREMEITPRTLIIPALFLSTALFCFNFLGDGLRDALDPRDR